MAASIESLQHLIDQAKALVPIRVAVADAAQEVVIETLRDAHALGFVAPRLVGDADLIAATCKDIGWATAGDWIVPASTDAVVAAKTVELVREGEADAVMKGNIHTDVLMHALLDKERGLRLPGQRVSHVFLIEVSTHPKLPAITGAAINLAPDLNAKAQILQNAVDLLRLLGFEMPKVAVLSAVETINPEIISTLDAAYLTLMARRGQIAGAVVDGPLAFDNAISRRAAEEKGTASVVGGRRRHPARAGSRVRQHPCKEPRIPGGRHCRRRRFLSAITSLASKPGARPPACSSSRLFVAICPRNCTRGATGASPHSSMP
ncbi:phosphate acyltransferase [Microbaculum sp. FT89]|uniref:phosphate acyltransferase n=1 Tax=Microbaculum sp. FT89 TaxID=3447298 RepID=UPI003F52ECBA